MNKNKILEALKFQPLSEEEKSKRHILGRLYGPIATCNEGTRNGRTYNHELWEKALNDEVFKEKVANKSLFLELGHPTDREETDMTKVCACIPEIPKIINGDLYAYVDILDTNNGKLLKTLCDYGFQPGISSRGSGDVMSNNEVDPDSFFLETWDIVQLPAVKKARLSVCESYNGKTLKSALTESFNKADSKGRKIMKEALNNLDINIKEEKEVDIDAIPWASEEIITEGIEDESDIDEIVDVKVKDVIEENPVSTYEIKFNKEEVKEVATEVGEKVSDKVKAGKKVDIEKIADKVIDKKVDIKTKELPDNESGDIEEIDDDSNDEPKSSNTKKEKSDKADDVGVEEILESVKDLVNQKDLLESELRTLRNEKAVSDAKVVKLHEEVEKYRDAFSRTSELASKTSKFEKIAHNLHEQLKEKDAKIDTLLKNRENTIKLTESMNDKAKKVSKLTESLNATCKELEATKTEFANYKAQSNKKLAESYESIKGYKSRFAAVVNRYIESKASMLGVRPSEIINRLNESYTLADVDKVYNTLLAEGQNYSSRLPFNGLKNVKMRTNESVSRNSNTGTISDSDYDDLIDFAGLKRN